MARIPFIPMGKPVFGLRSPSFDSSVEPGCVMTPVSVIETPVIYYGTLLGTTYLRYIASRHLLLSNNFQICINIFK